jgi:2,4-dienoyl-CoA reductase-like NADH-dependent reductase (Old Yellow Enzyme family)
VARLFTPLKLRGLEIPNRAWMAPMCMYSADAAGAGIGAATDFHLTHLASRAAGGAGLVMVEATAVRPDGRITPEDLGLWNDDQERSLSRVVDGIRCYGAVPAIQLAHAGRKAATKRPWISSGYSAGDAAGWQSVGPSANPFGNLPVPQELSVREIRQLAGDFGHAAKRALEAGFQAVEIHGAHGYLINSFLSPASNHVPIPTAAASKTGCASRSRWWTQSEPPGPMTYRFSSALLRQTG